MSQAIYFILFYFLANRLKSFPFSILTKNTQLFITVNFLNDVTGINFVISSVLLFIMVSRFSVHGGHGS